MNEASTDSLKLIANLIALNTANEVETSPLDEPALLSMLRGSFHWAAPAQGLDGLLISFDQDADYNGLNFTWFKKRYARFVYIDRVIVAEHRRGHGIARRLYSDLIAAMSEEAQTLLTCEINLNPPNPVSLAMHAAIGFKEIGQATLPNGKMVSYQALHLP